MEQERNLKNQSIEYSIDKSGKNEISVTTKHRNALIENYANSPVNKEVIESGVESLKPESSFTSDKGLNNKEKLYKCRACANEFNNEDDFFIHFSSCQRNISYEKIDNGEEDKSSELNHNIYPNPYQKNEHFQKKSSDYKAMRFCNKEQTAQSSHPKFANYLTRNTPLLHAIPYSTLPINPQSTIPQIQSNVHQNVLTSNLTAVVSSTQQNTDSLKHLQNILQLVQNQIKEITNRLKVENDVTKIYRLRMEMTDLLTGRDTIQKNIYDFRQTQTSLHQSIPQINQLRGDQYANKMHLCSNISCSKKRSLDATEGESETRESKIRYAQTSRSSSKQTNQDLHVDYQYLKDDLSTKHINLIEKPTHYKSVQNFNHVSENRNKFILSRNGTIEQRHILPHSGKHIVQSQIPITANKNMGEIDPKILDNFVIPLFQSENMTQSNINNLHSLGLNFFIPLQGFSGFCMPIMKLDSTTFTGHITH